MYQILHKQTTADQESNAVKQGWGRYDLNFDSKKWVLRRNNRRIWHIN